MTDDNRPSQSKGGLTRNASEFYPIRSNVKFFDHFISGTQKKYDEYLTEEQRALNLLCYEMWQLAENLPVSFIKEPIAEQEKIAALFDLWRKAFSLLQNQQYVFQYGLYWKREMKGKPSKQRVDKIEVRTETPRLQFHLSDRGDIYQLQLKASIKGRLHDNFFTDYLFFIRDEDTVYLLQSLKDVGIIE